MRVFAWVKHDRLDDEVMVIDLKSGAYFAFLGAAADAWTLLAAGHAPDAVGDVLADRYGVEAEAVGHDVRSFADQLVAEGLLADAPADELPAGDVPAGGVPPTDLGESSLPLVYTPPAIERFDDLADLLLLDPIHEVTEPGWPAGRED